MRTFLCLGAFLFSTTNAGYFPTGASRTYRADDGLGNYRFSYDETHSTGGTFRQESGNAFGAKFGSYGLRDVDGRYRVVHYVADEAGFRAQVSTNEPGTAPSLTAAASYNAAPPLPASPLVAKPIYGFEDSALETSASRIAAVPAFNALQHQFPVRLAVPYGSRIPYATPVARVPPATRELVPLRTPSAAPITGYAAAVANVATSAPLAQAALTFATPLSHPPPVAEAAPATYAAPVATDAIPPYVASVARFATPVETFASPISSYVAPISRPAFPLTRFAGDLNGRASGARVATVAANTSNNFSIPQYTESAAPSNVRPAPVPVFSQAPPSAPSPMNSAFPAATDSAALPTENGAHLFGQAAVGLPTARMSNGLRLSSSPYPPNSIADMVYSDEGRSNHDQVLRSAQRAASSGSSTPSAPLPFEPSATRNFPLARVDLTSPQLSSQLPAFSASFPFDVRSNSARSASVSDAPLSPVSAFGLSSAVASSSPSSSPASVPGPLHTEATTEPLLSSAAKTSKFSAPAETFSARPPVDVSAHEFDQVGPSHKPRTTSAPAVFSAATSSTVAPAPLIAPYDPYDAPTTGRVDDGPLAHSANPVDVSSPSAPQPEPVAAPAENATASTYFAEAEASAPASDTSADSSNAYFSPRRVEVPTEEISFSSQRLRAPIYAPVYVPVAEHQGAYVAPFFSQRPVYALVAQYTSSVHSHPDISTAPVVTGEVFARAPKSSDLSEQAVTTGPAPQTPASPAEILTTEEPAQMTSTEASTTSPTTQTEQDEVADSENSPPKFSANEDTSATTEASAFRATTEPAPPTTEIPTAAEAQSELEIKRRNSAQNVSEALPTSFATHRPVTRVVARRRSLASATGVFRAPSASEVFAPRHVNNVPIAHYTAAPVADPRAGRAPHALPTFHFY